jgi:biopolymer transport protein ExbD
MIDITFLLLIFFLVASIPDPQVAIELPTARYGSGVNKKTSVTLTVIDGGLGIAPVYAADGRVEGTELSRDAERQSEQIRQLVQQGIHDGKPNVVIKADGAVAEREVTRVAAAASQVEGVRLFVGVIEKE